MLNFIKKLFKRPTNVEKFFYKTIEMHRKMWNWIAENYCIWSNNIKAIDDTLAIKKCYFDYNKIKNIPNKYCYPCNFCGFIKLYCLDNLKGFDLGEPNNCENYCPLNWGTTSEGYPLFCICDDSLYELFRNESDPCKKVNIAKQIAELPINKTLEEFIKNKGYLRGGLENEYRK